jgi:hypothetical protein
LGADPQKEKRGAIKTILCQWAMKFHLWLQSRLSVSLWEERANQLNNGPDFVCRALSGPSHSTRARVNWHREKISRQVKVKVNFRLFSKLTICSHLVGCRWSTWSISHDRRRTATAMVYSFKERVRPQNYLTCDAIASSGLWHSS